MSNYIIGGWTQNLSAQAPSTFSQAIYGMVTDLQALKTGVPGGPGWSPSTTQPPAQASANTQVRWAYGGQHCTPNGMPASGADVSALANACGWAGVDFDDECAMNAGNIANAMSALKQSGKSTSYTFLAGWAYNNPDVDGGDPATNAAVQSLATAGVCDYFMLMCYGNNMWDMTDIDANVGPAIDRTLQKVGNSKKVILALTPDGLTTANRDYFLNQVTSKNLGGLFIWEWPRLSAADLAAIQSALGIS